MATITSTKVNAPKSRMLGVALGATVAVIAVALFAFYLGNSRTGHQAASASAAVAEVPIFIAMEPFTVNLQSEGRPRFLHIGVTLKVSNAKSQEQVTQYLPEARSRVLMLLSNRKPESLSTQDDKNQLATEILKTLNKPFSPSQIPQQITDVVFTAFVLQ
ncbi:flagellar basal body-associated protein FliL [Herminiimonas sp. CN]|uniref:flagellar basal body-associated protein FliL n=1 Tax=Herminiimonas sp. CN TaxID=1349818 RepID=UPI0004733352|nr:flagellar basal body-associated protein FliL [Herminiimonas sp. CN]